MTDEDQTDASSDTPRVIDAPDAIWLVYGELDHDDTHRELYASGEVTWCEDQQHHSDVRYVRADLVDKLRDAVSRACAMYPDDAIAPTCVAILRAALKLNARVQPP